MDGQAYTVAGLWEKMRREIKFEKDYTPERTLDWLMECAADKDQVSVVGLQCWRGTPHSNE